MVEKYFDKFQKVYYANTLSVNLTERAAISAKSYINPYLYYPTDLVEGIRPDQLADAYYNDQFMSWLIYFANDIIDPYYQWYLSEKELNDYLIKKYNVLTTDVLKQKIVYYRNNWYNDSSITVAVFESLLPEQKKYWEPIYTNKNYPDSYERKKVDWIINTNEVVSYTINVANNQFVNNEIVRVNDNSNFIGNGQITFSNTTTVKIQHTVGNTYSSTTGYLYGTESKANVAFTSSNLVDSNIPADEYAYWTPVYIYDEENERNEKNKSIRLLLANYAPQAAKDLKTLLK